MTHIVRTNSFFWDEPLQDLNEDTVVDNGGFVIASKVWSLFENPETTWVPLITDNGDLSSAGICLNGRVYWVRTICDCVQNWFDLDILEPYLAPVYVELIRMLVMGGYAWDLNYHFPALYLPLVGIDGLQSANIMSFVSQFPSDPHIEEIIDTSETVNTWDLTTEASLGGILMTFSWENMNDDDVIDEDVDFGDILAWE